MLATLVTLARATQAASRSTGRARSTPVSSVTKRPIQWLWRHWLALGKLHVLDGDPGLGKSTVLLDLTARVSTTGVMPDGSQGGTGAVVILSSEDSVEDTIRPRLEVAGADLDRVEFFDEVEDDGGTRPPSIPTDIGLLEEIVARKTARLLVIDPLMAYLGGVDSVKDQDVRRVLHQLKRLAERRNCAIVYLRHLNKGTGTKAMYRGGGSIGIIGAARLGMLVAEDPDDTLARVLACTKTNIGPKPTSLRYRLGEPNEDGVCRVEWMGECPQSADDLVASPEIKDERNALEEACNLLQAFLADGPRLATECYAEGRKIKISDQTLRRAKKKLGIDSQQNGESGSFQPATWALPPTAPPG